MVNENFIDNIKQYDIVIFLAAIVRTFKKSDYKKNIVGLKNTIKLMNPNQKFIYFSTQNVIIKKTGPYGDSKKKLAKMLKPEWGVDIIIGGHSHTVLEQPEKINNILIAQAGVGSNQIGRFDIEVDDDTNSIVKWTWKLIPITSDMAKPDKRLVNYIESYKTIVDKKYNCILGKTAIKLTHPKREIETSLGNLFADAFAEASECDVAFMGSGAIRGKELGPLITLQDFLTVFPYDDTYHRFVISGLKLKKIFEHFMRKENRLGEGECYQVNSKVKAIYSEKEKKLVSLNIDNAPVENTKKYTFSVAEYHYNCSKDYLNLTQEELNESGKSKVITTSVQEVMEEFLRNNQNISKKVEGRMVYLKK